MKKAFCTALSLLLSAAILTSCFSKTSTDETEKTEKTSEKVTEETTEETTETSEETEATTEPSITETEIEWEPIDENLTMEEKLGQLDGVVKVDNMRNDVYVVWFEHPIDWKDPSKGTFKQRVQVGNMDSDVTNINVNGYLLNDDYLGIGTQSYWQYIYATNCVNVEFRFFGKSVPRGLDPNDPELWQNLTS